jgi:AcrR family transcriptional regulator
MTIALTADPQAQESASTRDRLRAAAIHLFGEKGYDGTSMNELAERAGIAKPSIYNYYRSKEDLLLDLLDRGLSELRERTLPALAEPGTFEKRLAEHLWRVVEFMRERPHVTALCNLASQHVQGDLAARVEALAEHHRELTNRASLPVLEEAVASGEVDGATVEDLQSFLRVFFMGLTFQKAVCPPIFEGSVSRLPRLWRLLYRGLAGRPPTAERDG